MLKMLDLFSGIGGFSLAASWTGGIETVAFCEIEPYCQKVLHKHWPDVPIYPDIKQLRGEDIGSVDIVCGGFPCQPFSCAGKQRGKEDGRYLWPEMFRVIQETKPTWVVGENVAGLIELGLEDCFFNLEAEGYEVQALIIPACGVGAPHRRNRVWIVGYSKHNGLSSTEINRSTIKTGNNYQEGQNQASEFKRTGRPGGGEDVADTQHERPILSKPSARHWQGVSEDGGIAKQEPYKPGSTSGWDIEPNVGRVANGVPDRVDRLKALGNAIVPQVVYPILQGIVDIERQLREG